MHISSSEYYELVCRVPIANARQTTLLVWTQGTWAQDARMREMWRNGRVLQCGLVRL